ncbi:MAG: hypothetical protein DMG38_22005 [Acidobacteria bacterium]|nr:MAG: hypothetical protein DMG38_22005 [Acidobacteriota bacterium]
MPVISRAEDRGESIAQMEPLLIGETSRFRGPLTDLAVELVQKSARFRGDGNGRVARFVSHAKFLEALDRGTAPGLMGTWRQRGWQL